MKITKKFISVLLAAVLVISVFTVAPFAVNAVDVATEQVGASVNNFDFKELSDGTIEITKYTGSDTAVVIPGSINGKRVTSIGYNAFYVSRSEYPYEHPYEQRYVHIESVTIPYGVTNIGERAFYYCSYLKSIIIPGSVTSIGNWAFAYCEKLESITIPNSVKSLGEYAFFECDSIKSVKIGNGLTTIRKNTFYNCNKLESVVIPNSVTSIEDHAFAVCASLTSISIPSSVTSIHYNAFLASTKLSCIYVDSGNPAYTADGGVLFNKNKTELVYYPCSKSDVSYSIPNSVTKIWTEAFAYSVNLENLTITDNVKSIGDLAFRSSKIKNLYVSGNNPVYSDINGILFNKNKTELICFVTKRSETSYTVPSSVKSIAKRAFYGTNNLKTLTIPSSVTIIGENAFYYNLNLQSVIISGNGLKTIDKSAFYVCNSLKSITIPNSVTSIGERAFSDCRSLTSITIPDNEAD